MWLAGASLPTIVLGSGDANAVSFGPPGIDGYIIPSTGYYDFRVAGADGGGQSIFQIGGIGAVVGGELFFDAGEALEFVVGGAGGSAFNYAGSGGGGSFVFRGGGYLSGGLLFDAGGGGGSDFGVGSGGPPGIGHGGSPSGPATYGGGGGTGNFYFGGFPGQPPAQPAQPGSFPNGGAGAFAFVGAEGGPSGGFSGGGGGGYDTGGGGGGAPGGGSGQGGYSYVIDTARNAFGITVGNMNGPSPSGYAASGYVSINFVAAPEPSIWAMTLTGFAGLGWLARLRRRKLMPA